VYQQASNDSQLCCIVCEAVCSAPLEDIFLISEAFLGLLVHLSQQESKVHKKRVKEKRKKSDLIAIYNEHNTI